MSFAAAWTPGGTLHLLYQGEWELEPEPGRVGRQPGEMTMLFQNSPQAVGSWTTEYLRQIVQLPDDLKHPTLAFFYKAPVGDPLGKSQLQVAVTADITTTVVFTSPAVGAWTHGWADLEPWAGTAVTVTFAISQAAGDPLLRIYLDDVTVGAWTTPVITAVEPAWIPTEWDNALLTITGDNFAPTPVLRIGQTLLTAVQWVDSHTVTGRLPAGLGAGKWVVRIANPDQQGSVAQGAVQLGTVAYLPVVSGR